MEQRLRILIVNRNRRNLELLTAVLGREGFEILAITTLEEFDFLLERGAVFQFAVVDLCGFNPDIWQRCEWLHRKKIPFLLVSSATRFGAAIEQKCHRHGGRAVLVKPLAPKSLVGIVRLCVQTS